MPTDIPIDLFFSYISILGAIPVALVFWGAWKLTEPDDKKRPGGREFSASGGSSATSAELRIGSVPAAVEPPAII